MKAGLPYIAQDIKLVGIQDSGHYLNEEKPDQVINAVMDFLESKK